MLVGHVGAAFALKRLERRASLALLLFLAMFADFLLGVFVAFGLERVEFPADYARRHVPHFHFPWSHGLAPLAAWAAAAAWIASRGAGAAPRRVGLAAAAAVLSHWVLDGVVHEAGLPLLGPGSPALGLGLWNHPWLELPLETGIGAAGLALFLGIGGIGRARAAGAALLVALCAALTVFGLTASFAPPPVAALVPQWLGFPVVLALAGLALEPRARAGGAA